MEKTLEMLAQKGQFHLSTELQAKLASRGFTDIVSDSANGELKYIGTLPIKKLFTMQKLQ